MGGSGESNQAMRIPIDWSQIPGFPVFELDLHTFDNVSGQNCCWQQRQTWTGEDDMTIAIESRIWQSVRGDRAM